MSAQVRMPVFTRSEIVHRRQLNLERNVYWTRYHSWFIDSLEEFLISLVPSLRERFISGELQITTFDTYIEHKISVFLYETVCINLKIGGLDTKESLVKVLVTFTRGNDVIAEGWQRMRFIDAKGKAVAIPDEIVKEVKVVVDEILSDLVIDKGPSKEPFVRSRKVFLHHTDRNGNTYPLVYLEWFAEVREEFITHLTPDFTKRFAAGMRILTHDTYLRNYEDTASFNDTVMIDIKVGDIRPASAKLLFTQTKEGDKLSEGWQTVVFANEQGKLARIPTDILWNARNYTVKGLNLLKLLSRIKE